MRRLVVGPVLEVVRATAQRIAAWYCSGVRLGNRFIASYAALSNRMPVAAPCASRTITPPLGFGVFASMPSSARARIHPGVVEAAACDRRGFGPRARGVDRVDPSAAVHGVGGLDGEGAGREQKQREDEDASPAGDGSLPAAMKTLGLVSDTHGLLRPEALAALSGVVAVRGNNDLGVVELEV